MPFGAPGAPGVVRASGVIGHSSFKLSLGPGDEAQAGIDDLATVIRARARVCRYLQLNTYRELPDRSNTLISYVSGQGSVISS